MAHTRQKRERNYYINYSAEIAVTNGSLQDLMDSGNIATTLAQRRPSAHAVAGVTEERRRQHIIIEGTIWDIMGDVTWDIMEDNPWDKEGEMKMEMKLGGMKLTNDAMLMWLCNNFGPRAGSGCTANAEGKTISRLAARLGHALNSVSMKKLTKATKGTPPTTPRREDREGA